MSGKPKEKIRKLAPKTSPTSKPKAATRPTKAGPASKPKAATSPKTAFSKKQVNIVQKKSTTTKNNSFRSPEVQILLLPPQTKDPKTLKLSKQHKKLYHKILRENFSDKVSLSLKTGLVFLFLTVVFTLLIGFSRVDFLDLEASVFTASGIIEFLTGADAQVFANESNKFTYLFTQIFKCWKLILNFVLVLLFFVSTLALVFLGLLIIFKQKVFRRFRTINRIKKVTSFERKHHEKLPQTRSTLKNKSGFVYTVQTNETSLRVREYVFEKNAKKLTREFAPVFYKNINYVFRWKTQENGGLFLSFKKGKTPNVSPEVLNALTRFLAEENLVENLG